MTKLRHCRECGQSLQDGEIFTNANYFHRLLDGLGKRGSSFSDIDGVSHDLETKRFLVQEWKREGEILPTGQHWMLRGLTEIPKHFTVWQVLRRADGLLEFALYGEPYKLITPLEYQDRFKSWWASRLYRQPFNEVAEERAAIQDEGNGKPIKLHPWELTADEIFGKK